METMYFYEQQGSQACTLNPVDFKTSKLTIREVSDDIKDILIDGELEEVKELISCILQ